LHRYYNPSTLKQALLALACDFGGVIAGRLMIVFAPLFGSVPWILALFTPMLTIRGNISGILSGKLSTMLHTGEVEPKFRDNTREFYGLIRAIFVLTFVDTVGIGAIAFAVNSLFFATTSQYLYFFLLVPVLTCVLAMAVAVPVASFVGIKSFKRGLDPSIVLYPLMSTIDDVFVTLCYVLVINVALIPGAIVGMAAAALLLLGIVLVVSARSRGERIFVRTLEEGAPIVLFSSLLGTFGGVALSSFKDDIESDPTVLMLYPAMIDMLGDIGSILGTMQTTKLALGYVESLWNTLKVAFADMVSVESAAAFTHFAFSLAAFAMGTASGLSPNLAMLIALSLISNAFGFLFISVFSLLIATQTFKYGLDPDNFVIPLVTSVSDIIATLAFGTSLAILGAL